MTFGREVTMMDPRKNMILLWISTVSPYYFLIPNDVEFSKGDFIIYTLNGDEKKVDFMGIEPFVAVQEEVKSYLQAEMSQALERVKQIFSEILIFSAQTSTKNTSSTPSSTTDSQPVIYLVAALLGIPPDQLQQSPDTIQADILNFSTQLQEIIRNTLSGQPAQQVTAHEQQQALQELLQVYGIDLGEHLEQFPDKLRNLHQSSDEASHPVKDITNKLRTLADSIDEAFLVGGQGVDNAMQDLSNSLKDLLAEDDPATAKAKRDQEYRQIAKNTVDSIFERSPMSPLTFDDLLSNVKPVKLPEQSSEEL
jgi:hypothetical protein